jgi:uncharacterized protein
MKKHELSKRYLVCLVGILMSAIGITFLTKSGLGTSQISSLPYVASVILSISLGMATFVINIVFVLAQVAILRKEFTKRDLLQLPLNFVFCFFIDITMFVFAALQPSIYALKIALCVAGCAFIALGISLQIVSKVSILPGDGIVRAITRKTGKNFGTIKTIFDLSLVASAVVLSFAVLRTLIGVREGTIIAALIVGTISRFCLDHLGPVNRWLERSAA